MAQDVPGPFVGDETPRRIVARVDAMTHGLVHNHNDLRTMMPLTLAEILPKGMLVEVPGGSSYVQHSSPAQCVALWLDFVKAVRS